MAKQHQTDSDKKEELHTEHPISEKDEVKEAEERTAKQQPKTKKTDNSVAADLKNREHE
ncbi:hypothetical protein IM792_09985 [Mucilaginibacter sp. JRF]|uniref:hypothetical protein n=1 Tax=Mucilaginibacter sp. JRF TaxID=2780088 RepID=UPI001881F8EE|nr:hypothetical protein [Mucilaginibacter sp. JRF]MBE9584775.1 hypothetical protein [Mucilaginibacter sp. JRF]